MDEDATRPCYGCGVEVDEFIGYEVDGKLLCESCMGDYGVCEDCHGLFHLDDMKTRENGDLLCQPCLKSHLERCTCCGDVFDQEIEEGRGDSWGDMCPNCASQHFICDNCDETLHNDCYGGNGLCIECYDSEEEEEARPLRGYHNRPSFSPIFQPKRGYPLYFGIELETDDYSSNRQEVAEQLFDLSNEEELFWLERDCSLDNGIELITQPCILNYHRKLFPWKEVMEVITKGGGKGEKTNTAALHIHFNRSFFGRKQSELYQLRLIYLFEKFRDELITLGRTSEYLMHRSAKKYNCELHNTSAKDKIRELRLDGDRMFAVNLTSRETIEIRIFRSTLRVNTIKASLELVDFLVRLAKSYSTRKLQKLTWDDLLGLINKRKYRYLPAYAEQCLRNGVRKEKDIPKESVPQTCVRPVTLRELTSIHQS